MYKKCDRGADVSFFLQRHNGGRCQVHADTALSIFSLLKRQVRFKYLSKFTLASIEFHLSKQILVPHQSNIN